MAKLAAGLIVFRRLAPSASIEYLLMQTSYGNHHWTPPKGHLDEGETDMMAAVRETREEAGLVQDRDYKIINKEIVSNYVIDGIKPKQVTYWLAEVINPAQVKVEMSEEHQDYKWLKLSEACDHAGYDEMKRVLIEAERLINQSP